ncbi:hypothetical protein ATCC90586_002600 [Pythium insidiosum]|nr:hypothetical protein ATCC90586_002600 [Pythium insidiosum]
MVDQVLVHVAVDAPSHCSTATISRALSARLRVAHGSYVQLSASSRRQRVFRVAVDLEREETDGVAAILHVNQWPALNGENEATSSSASPLPADLSVVSPARVRVVQFVELAPATLDPPKLSLAMARVLLQRQILHDSSGILSLRLDNISYGDWRFRVYFRGRQQDVNGLVGVVTDETMIMFTPFAPNPTSNATVVQDVGAHGRALQQLLALALDPPALANESADDARDSPSFAALQPKSIILHGPSGAGKSTTVRLVANGLGVNMLTVDCSILATPQFRLEDIFTAAIRIQPAIVLLEDLELIFPRTLDETKYKLICRFVACLDRLRASGNINVAVVGNVTTISALNPKIRQVFEEQVAIEDIAMADFTTALAASRYDIRSQENAML